jgi:hypothetical protein
MTPLAFAPLRRAGRVRLALFALALAVVAALPTTAPAQDIPTPEEFFGFQMGADRKLARWDRMVEYYQLLGELSPRLQVVDMGPSTLGNPFLALYISSPENLARLNELKALNATLSDPRGATDAAIDSAVANGRAVLVQSFGLHSSEVAASQTAVELTYDMVTRTDPEMMAILENTVAIMIPCFNPDGEIMITDWYDRWVDTEYEGASLPWLYHHYIGHDNNRDAFMANTVESRYGQEILFREWVPQAYIDHHQMGAYGARIYVPPYAEPIRPDGDPLVWREMSWYGAHIAYKEEQAGMSGVVNSAVYSGWGHFGFHWITPFHNIAGMLTESASARLATPLYLHPDQLRGETRGLPDYEAQTTFPNPWPGGWWRVRDMVDRQKIAALAALDIAARDRETVLRNAYLKASRQTERGAEGKPAAFVIPAEQHDPLTMAHMVNKLLGQGIDVRRAGDGFTHEGRVYGAGAFVVSMAQPKRGVIRWLLGRTFYPDNSYTRNADGAPIRPYDMSTDNIAEFMGVRVDPVDEPVTTPTELIGEVLAPAGTVAKGAFGSVFSGRQNAAFRAMNLLQDEGVPLRRVDRAGMGDGTLAPGDFVVPASAPDAVVRRVAAETGVDFMALETDPAPLTYLLPRNRIAMYQRYGGGNMDEGWTRWLLEDFRFRFASLMDDELTASNLNDSYDVIILPDDSPGQMIGGGEGRGGGGGGGTPPGFASGFGQEGVRALDAFVRNGGTLVTFARAGALAIEELSLPVRNVVEDVPTTEFWSPGSTLRVRVDTADPLAWGMPEDALATFLQGNHVYQLVPVAENERARRVVTFASRDLLRSGWLDGEDIIADKAAMVAVEHGRGQVVLIGFRAQHRAQTHGTFKLVFNALVGGPPGM